MSKIFILEDDPDRIDWFNDAFKGSDITVTADVHEACNKIESESYDLICLDRDLGDPQLTGEDVAWHMYQNKLAKSTPVIIHSDNTRGQRVMKRYLDKYKKNVAGMQFKLLKKASLEEVLKSAGFGEKKVASPREDQVVKKGQSIFDFLFDNKSIDTGNHLNINNNRAKAAKSLFQIWQNQKNKVGSNIYRKPIELSNDDIDNIAKEGFANCVGDKIKITKAGSDILKTMILGDDRCTFDDDYDKPIELKVAEANIKKKKTVKGVQKSHEGDWWKSISK